MDKLKVLSLFAGCGGLDIGARLAGAEVIFSSELEKKFCDTLRANGCATSVVEGPIQDIHTFPNCDIVIGGYPCQSFSIAGNRNPEKDSRTYLYQEFARVVEYCTPKFFIAENVDGLQKLQQGKFFNDQLKHFSNLNGVRYRISHAKLNACDYGVPQKRKRVFIVGIREDIGAEFVFPKPTHGKPTKLNPCVKPYASHGETIKHLPLWPTGEFYERPHDPEGHFSWYYMSRNRKAAWDGPGFTVVANWRHTTIHPASPTMKLTWSDLKNGWKQRWDFSSEWEHLAVDPNRIKLDQPRRFSWREASLIQTFPADFEPVGSVEEKFTQIGNAVPPMLAKVVLEAIVGGLGLQEPRRKQLAFSY